MRRRLGAGRAVAGVALAVVLGAAAVLVAAGVLVGGCAHDCSSGEIAAQMALAAGAGVAVLSLLAVGLVGLRRWSWPGFGLYVLALVALARVAEFTLTRI